MKRNIFLIVMITCALLVACGTQEADRKVTGSTSVSGNAVSAGAISGGAVSKQKPSDEKEEKSMAEKVDWTAYREKLSAEQYQTVESFLPILTEGENVTLIDSDWDPVKEKVVEKKTRTNLGRICQEYSDEQGDWTGQLSAIAVVDVFQSGTLDLVLGMKFLHDGTVLLHRDKKTVYAWVFSGKGSFWELQNNGMTSGFGESKEEIVYTQMRFRDGERKTEELASELHEWEYQEETVSYFVAGKEVSRKEFKQWKKKYFSDEAKYVKPVRNN